MKFYGLGVNLYSGGYGHEDEAINICDRSGNGRGMSVWRLFDANDKKRDSMVSLFIVS